VSVDWLLHCTSWSSIDDLSAAGAVLPELEHSSNHHSIAMAFIDCSVKVCVQLGKRQS